MCFVHRADVGEEFNNIKICGLWFLFQLEMMSLGFHFLSQCIKPVERVDGSCPIFLFSFFCGGDLVIGFFHCEQLISHPWPRSPSAMSSICVQAYQATETESAQGKERGRKRKGEGKRERERE